MRGPSIVFVALVMLGGCTITSSEAPPPAAGPGAGAAGLESGVDRPGSDYRSFDLSSGRPEECRDACMAESPCVAFTFVSPGLQGPSARCWLKNVVAPAVPNSCCISGVKGYAGAATAPQGAGSAWVGTPPPAPPPPQPSTPPPSAWRGTPPPAPPAPAGGAWEMNMNRAGSDYNNFDLPQPRAELCRDACMRDWQCRAFTYVNPGVQGPSARCWLKNAVPAGHMDACCISGVK